MSDSSESCHSLSPRPISCLIISLSRNTAVISHDWLMWLIFVSCWKSLLAFIISVAPCETLEWRVILRVIMRHAQFLHWDRRSRPRDSLQSWLMVPRSQVSQSVKSVKAWLWLEQRCCWTSLPTECLIFEVEIGWKILYRDSLPSTSHIFHTFFTHFR